jgi:hypothetical protein
MLKYKPLANPDAIENCIRPIKCVFKNNNKLGLIIPDIDD